MSKQGIQAGDWVCFMLSRQVVYAKVEYRCPRSSWERSDTLVTTAGDVKVEAVLEVRKAEAQS